MKILCATFKHETNTFSPIVTDLARFRAWGLHFDADARRAMEGTAMPQAAYMKLAQERGAEVVTPVAAEAMPAGPVTADAYERLADAILEAAEGCDAALLDLHGAMVSESADDGEGELLRRLRAAHPDLPIAVTLDLHCNLTQTMVDNCTALIGYKTYPHIDMYEVAEQVGRIVLDAMEGTVEPVMRWARPPLLSQTLRQGTDDAPMAGLIAEARRLEGDVGILAATVFGGFPLADIEDAGTSAILVADAKTDGAVERAQAGANALAEAAWAARADFIYQGRPIGEAVAEASRLNHGPIVLLDHADNCGSGATQDVMTAIQAVVRAGLDDVAVATVWDPQAVAAMGAAGVGAELTLDLGGKTDMPSIGLEGRPMRTTGVVEALSDGRFQVEGPMYTGITVDCGPSALFRIGGVRLIVTSHHHEPWDLGVFRMMGLAPETIRYLMLKSRIHYRAGFGDLARHTLTLDGEGVTTSDNALLRFEKVRRPIYPLDPDAAFP
ncbi:MAG: M81 family metallopeptidase [Marivibrio sp.]|uniref:M81 family metallopeptidase n=1 Tax=Marivibrio sp. TaxID=2039719 RepID=UPI0032EEFB90